MVTKPRVGWRSKENLLMRNNVCPKCGSNEIIRVPGQVGVYGAGNNIPIGWTNLSSITVTRYVCGHCGFSEEWIDYRDSLEKLKKKYGTNSNKKN